MLCWFANAAAHCPIPQLLDTRDMLGWFHRAAAAGAVPPFLGGLCWALGMIDRAAPGYAHEKVRRLAAIPGTGVDPYEAVVQELAEVYAAAGAVEVADRNEDGVPVFIHEPRVAGGKNPEFESCYEGIVYAVEVKTPKLINHRNSRGTAPYQILARLPKDLTEVLEKTLPRDNPVKDFLISANEKFEAYTQIRPHAFRILTIVWDDYCNEPISALLHPAAGLLTQNSFHRGSDGAAIVYPQVDAVLICRYHHQLLATTRNEPMIDGETLPFMYHHAGFPPKALIQNPHGRVIPQELLTALAATPLEGCLGAEYIPADMVMWMGDE